MARKLLNSALWIKKYFEIGYGLTSLPKYIIVASGLVVKDVKWILMIGTIYAILSTIAGYLWINYKLYEYEIEISNQLNPFVNEVREKLK